MDVQAAGGAAAQELDVSDCEFLLSGEGGLRKVQVNKSPGGIVMSNEQVNDAPRSAETIDGQSARRARWTPPKLRAMSAGDAELGTNPSQQDGQFSVS